MNDGEGREFLISCFVSVFPISSECENKSFTLKNKQTENYTSYNMNPLVPVSPSFFSKKKPAMKILFFLSRYQPFYFFLQ